jgi:hypothetical protein
MVKGWRGGGGKTFSGLTGRVGHYTTVVHSHGPSSSGLGQHSLPIKREEERKLERKEGRGRHRHCTLRLSQPPPRVKLETAV